MDDKRLLARLAELGVLPECINIEKTTSAFLSAMNRGLSGEDSSILMLPTYLSADGAAREGEPVAVIDAGGTNLRCALVSFSNGAMTVEGLERCRMPGTGGRVSWDEFISEISERALPLMGRTRKIGFCFSYPAEITPERDGRVIQFTKQVDVTGAKGKLAGACLCAELERHGISGARCVVLNDTAAALMGGSALLSHEKYDGFAGLIFGTGLNTCCSLPAERITKLRDKSDATMLINLESGGFLELPQGEIDLLLDGGTADPGEYIHEKMAAGAYLGELARLTLISLADSGEVSGKMGLSLEMAGHMDASDTDEFIRNPRGSGVLAAACEGDGDILAAEGVIHALAERAARLVSANLTALLRLTGRGRVPDRPACIVAEGSTFHKSKLLRPMLERQMAQYAGERLGLNWEIASVENINLAGSAYSALLNL